MTLAQLLMTSENIDQISRQFGLSQDQTVEAMQALLPAFSEGLKRQTATPRGASNFVEALSGGHHAQYIETPQRAFSGAGVADGIGILGHLFGNKDVSRGVAANAAQASGLSSTLLKKMLPVIASMVMGAIFKGAKGSGAGDALGRAAGGGLLGQLIEGVAEGFLHGGKSATRSPSRRRNGNGLEDMLGDLLGGGSRRSKRASRRSTRRQTRGKTAQKDSGGGLGDLLGDLLGGGSSRSRKTAQRRRDPVMPQTRQSRRRRKPVTKKDVFGDMLDAGVEASPRYRKETRDVFDQLLGN